jgi:CRISPR/Cas system CSM-associated protein Csm4 (group 5 of RAMP superfamily)
MLFKKKVSRIPEPPNDDFQETRSFRNKANSNNFFNLNSHQEEMPVMKDVPKKDRRKIEDLPFKKAETMPEEMNEEIDEMPTDFNQGFKAEKKEKKQIFIKIDKFKQIVASLESIENKLKELDSVMARLEELSSEESSEIESWKSDVDGIKGEIRNIGSNLSED